MRKLRVTVLNLVPQGPATSLWARVFNPNMVGIMPSVVAAWCARAGHEARVVTYTGFEDLETELQHDAADLVFLAATTRSALFAAAVASLYRRRGIVTVLGGPHARCYPDDAARYFDYVVGFADQEIITAILADPAPRKPLGVRLSAARQLTDFPALEERWPYIEPTLAKAPAVRFVPMISAVGCPYRCGFCCDAEVPYSPIAPDAIRADLRFLLRTVKRPRIGWHDPNFGVRFDEVLDVIEESVPAGAIDHVAESSLSVLTEPRVQRLKRAGFKAMLPGVESWFDLGDKSRTGSLVGRDKVRHVAAQVNTVLRHIPFVQVNFVLGLDSDEGSAPFDLTREFVDLAPGAFPVYCLRTAFGEGAPENLELQRAGRVLPTPFHFLDNNQAMNVRPLHYRWDEFYDHMIALGEYSFSWRAIGRRLAAQGLGLPGFTGVLRGVSSEGWGHLEHYRVLRQALREDRDLRRFVEGETAVVPEFYRQRIRRKLGAFWEHLPEGALDHDPNAWWNRARNGNKASG